MSQIESKLAAQESQWELQNRSVNYLIMILITSRSVRESLFVLSNKFYYVNLQLNPILPPLPLGLFSLYYEAHIHYAFDKVNKRNMYHKSYINGKSVVYV